LYNRIQREKLNELGRKFKIINKKHQEALKKHHISLI
jgi:hypothetical protein